MLKFKVLITTSGIGNRLGGLTEFTNNSLIRIGDKPAISRIIESYPMGTEYIITLGHFGDHVRQYLQIAHTDRDFIFVEVDKFSGEGSSQLYSMRCAKEHLQSPFIFHAGDTITTDKIIYPSENWVAASKVENGDQYRTLKLNSNLSFEGFNKKGEISFEYAYPGLCGVNSYKEFWKSLDTVLKKEENQSISDCDVINEMISNLRDDKANKFKIVVLDRWHDIGNSSELEKTRKFFKPVNNVLDKSNESIYFVNNNVVKFFSNKEMNINRVKRAKVLSGLVPEILTYTDNFFKYSLIDGTLFSKSVTPRKMEKFLYWANEKMWSKTSNADIHDSCFSFYFEKTRMRIEKNLINESDIASRINDELIPPVFEMINKIDKNLLCDGIPALMHGDLTLDNIIETESGFSLIDWRQDFANNIDIGDVYYDLAKINHSLIFNHDLINRQQYKIKFKEDNIECDILCSKNLLDCKDVFNKFLIYNNFNLKKVEILTSLVWINMSPLHEHPLDKFLFNFGKYNLFLNLRNEGKI